MVALRSELAARDAERAAAAGQLRNVGVLVDALEAELGALRQQVCPPLLVVGRFLFSNRLSVVRWPFGPVRTVLRPSSVRCSSRSVDVPAAV